MKRALLFALLAGGCITSSDGLLFVDLTFFPVGTTSDSIVTIAGMVVRSPPKRDAVKVVTITGGIETVVDTASSQADQFSSRVQLVQGAVNTLAVSARDNTGAVSGVTMLEITHVIP